MKSCRSKFNRDHDAAQVRPTVRWAKSFMSIPPATPIEILEQREEHELLTTALASLTDQERAAVVAVHLLSGSDRSILDLCGAWDCTRQTIHNIAKRGRNRIARYFGVRGHR